MVHDDIKPQCSDNNSNRIILKFDFPTIHETVAVIRIFRPTAYGWFYVLSCDHTQPSCGKRRARVTQLEHKPCAVSTSRGKIVSV